MVKRTVIVLLVKKRKGLKQSLSRDLKLITKLTNQTEILLENDFLIRISIIKGKWGTHLIISLTTKFVNRITWTFYGSRMHKCY